MLTSIGDPNCVWLTTGRQTTNIYEKYMSIFKILCLRSGSGEEILFFFCLGSEMCGVCSEVPAGWADCVSGSYSSLS